MFKNFKKFSYFYSKNSIKYRRFLLSRLNNSLCIFFLFKIKLLPKRYKTLSVTLTLTQGWIMFDCYESTSPKRPNLNLAVCGICVKDISWSYKLIYMCFHWLLGINYFYFWTYCLINSFKLLSIIKAKW